MRAPKMSRILVAATLAALLATNPFDSQAADPGTTWPRRTPTEVGLNVAKLNELRAATGWTSGNATLRGFVVKNGFQVYSWGNVAQRGDWASAVKPLMSTMLFYAVDELKTSGVNARIFQYGWPLIGPDQQITWLQLGAMTSGYGFPDEGPGARWAYNDWATALYCRTLFTQSGDSISVFGQTMAQAVAQRLSPLQFQDGGVIGAGRNGCQLFTSIRDAARIGQFWMNRGAWRGVQRLPTSYFDNFGKSQVDANLPKTAGSPTDDYLHVAGTTGGGPNQTQFDGRGRYGFNWWFNEPLHAWASAPTDTFAAMGHHNAESIFIIPSRQIVFTCKCKNSAPENIVADGNRYLRLLIEAHQ
jgi:hypothetical protein